MNREANPKVLIIGGGAAGITVAASLKRRGPRNIDVVIVEPSHEHYYQPALTLVGAGVCKLADIRRAEEGLVPHGVRRIAARAKSFDPASSTVQISTGETLGYDYLVVCTGVKLDWGKIDGLAATLGRNGVCSNYSPDYVNYTAECLDMLKPGSKAVFTQPPLPFKCPGAPQKIVYLAADRLRKSGMLGDVSLRYFVHAPVIFGVPYFARALAKVVERYGIDVKYQHNLVAVDGPGRVATFETTGDGDQGRRIDIPFDMLHVVPPQSPHDEIASSPLANAAGWVEVDPFSLQHVRFPNVFSLGDVCSAPNSKTAAAVRKQAPVVVRNITNLVNAKPVEAGYDGYASCPLTTAIGKTILAEFIYGGKVTPTLPLLDPAKERWVNWWIKVTGLPIMYWRYMLKGHEWFLTHNTKFKERS
ncbi:MAG: FAD-dependent oxidoreductase [Alphaproteobacteria bacterium]